MNTLISSQVSSTIDIFEKIHSWFSSPTNAKNSIIKGLQLPTDALYFKATNVKGTKTTDEIIITYGEIHFMNVSLIISLLKIDLTSKTLTLTASPRITGAPNSWNITDSLPNIDSLEVLDGLIKNPEFTFSLSVNTQKTPVQLLSFKCNVSTSGTGLTSNTNKFLNFFGQTGIAQQFLHHFNGGVISEGIQLSGTIDFANPIETSRSGDVPNIQLNASLTNANDRFTLFNFLSVKNPRLSFKTISSGATKTKPTPLSASIEPSFEMDLIIGHQDPPIALALSCGVPPSLSSVTLTAANTINPKTKKLYEVGLIQVFELMNGNSWAGMIPGTLQSALDDITFKSVSANINFPEKRKPSTDDFALNWITVEIDSNPNKKINVGHILKECQFTAVWKIFKPLKKVDMHSSVDFNATTTCKIGTIPFDIDLSISK